MRRILLLLAAIPLLFCSCKQESEDITAPSDVERLLTCIPTDAVSFIFTTEAKNGIKAFSRDTGSLPSYARLELKEYNRSAASYPAFSGAFTTSVPPDKPLPR